MKALVLDDYRQLVYRDIADPMLGPHDVMVAVHACGICGSDIHGMDGRTGRRRPPIIMGHEAAGIIADIGSGVANWRPGDRVTFDSTVYCGKCLFCKSGRVNLCDNRRVFGVSCEEYRMHGAFADYVAVPERILYRLPDDLPFERAAFVEPVSIALHALHRSGAVRGDSAVVIGAGMIGLIIIQALQAQGIELVVAVDTQASRLEIARKLGANHVVNAANCDASKGVRELTGGSGVGHAFEAVGLSESVGCALNAVQKGGTVTLVGNMSPSVQFPLQVAVTREISIFGSCACSGEYPLSLSMLSERSIDVVPLLSMVAPLSDGAHWFERLYKQESGLMKVILNPTLHG